jgi:SAM-dependent methyltransferase
MPRALTRLEIRGRPARSSAKDPYDRIAPIYDDDMARNNPGRDVVFYVARCRGAGTVLELGCGTGRISLPLVRAGLDVAALDRSRPMLEELRRKCRALHPVNATRLRLYWRDMRDGWDFSGKFDRILCPFSAFTYVVTDGARERVLRRIRRRLERDGLFILDLFVPRPEILRLPDDHVFHDYRRRLADGTLLEREKTIATDAARRLQVVRRTYRRLGPRGTPLESFTTRSRIRYCFPEEMRRLLEAHGFEIVETSGDFDGAMRAESGTTAWVCRPR